MNTSLNLDIWHYILKEFPLSVNYDMFCCNSENGNHASATNFPQDAQLQHNALAGPFKAFLSCPKESDSRRIIVNLSYPEGNSVNSHILKDEYDGYKFQLSYTSVIS